MNSQYKFIYFDQGGVLFTEVGLRNLAKELNIDYALFQDVYAKYGSMVCTGKINAEELWQKYKDEIGFTYQINSFKDYWISQSVVFDRHILHY